MLNFYIYHSKIDYKKELANVNVRFDHIFDYNITISKVIKNDFYKKVPNEDIVSYYLYKELDKYIKKNENKNLLYIVKDFNQTTLDNIKITINDLCNFYDKTCNVVIFNKN